MLALSPPEGRGHHALWFDGGDAMVKQQKIVLLAAGVAGALVAAILLVGAVAEVAAQDGRGRPGFERGGGRGSVSLLGPGAGLEAANLTDAQKDQVKSIVDARRDEIRALLDRQAQARRTLAAAADRGQVDEAAATEVGHASAALALAEARLRAEVLQLLTPEQRAAVQQRAAERAERQSERRRGDRR
jgi:periplasmic protein CpxP/Spy